MELARRVTSSLLRHLDTSSNLIRGSVENHAQIGGRVIASLRDATVGYGKNVVLHRVSIAISAGEFVAIVGPNGSGKSTLSRALLGLEPLREGEREIFGIKNPSFQSLAGRVSYIPQRLSLNPMLPLTGREFLELKRRSVRGMKIDGRFLTLLGDGAEEILNKSLHRVSGGELQRLFLVFALLGAPELIFLDEGAEGIDPKAQEQTYKYLKEIVSDSGASVVLVSHDITAVSMHCDRVICLNENVVFDGSPRSEEFHTCLHDTYGEGSLIHDHRHKD